MYAKSTLSGNSRLCMGPNTTKAHLIVEVERETIRSLSKNYIGTCPEISATVIHVFTSTGGEVDRKSKY